MQEWVLEQGEKQIKSEWLYRNVQSFEEEASLSRIWLL